MEAWSLYLSIQVFLDPSCAPHLIDYQCIITTANSNHPLQSWIKYEKNLELRLLIIYHLDGTSGIHISG